MGKPGVSRAQSNRELRRQNLRDYLSARQLTRQVAEISNLLAHLDVELSSREVGRLKAAADIKLQLIKKFLPDARPESDVPETPEPGGMKLPAVTALLDSIVAEAELAALPQICHSNPPQQPTLANNNQRSDEPTC